MYGQEHGCEWAYLLHSPIQHLVAYLLNIGAEEGVLDYFNIEALIALEGIEPLASDPAFIHHKGLFTIQLLFPWVEVKSDKEGC